MTRYLIIGDGAAGTTAAQELRRRDPEGDIQIYSNDPNPAYYRAALTNYLIGELRDDQIWAVPATFYSEYNIRRKLATVTAVELEKSQIRIDSSERPVAYDKLLIAAGSRARAPRFKNAKLPGIMTMRSLQDVREVMDLIRMRGLKEAVIIGGGPLALEWAQGLHERRVRVTIILRGDRFMRASLDATGSDLVLARLKRAGITVLTHEEVVEAIPNKSGSLGAVKIKSGSTIRCQLAGVAIGVECNSEFVTSTGLTLSGKGALLVDETMLTATGNVYAAGDVAEVHGSNFQLWEPAKWQGRVAGKNMGGGDDSYDPGSQYFATRLFDLDYAMTGLAEPKEGDTQVVDMPKGTGSDAYRKVILRNGVIVGALLLGQRATRVRRDGRLFKRLVDRRINVSSVADKLLDPHFDLQGWVNRHRIGGQPGNRAATGEYTLSGLQGADLGKLIDTDDREARPSQAITIPDAVLESQAGGESFSIARHLKVGRDPQNDIVLDDSFSSAFHAEVIQEAGAFFVIDLDSKNGTFLNGKKIKGRQRLPGGSKVKFAQTEYTFRMSDVITPRKPDIEIQKKVKAGPAQRLATVGLSTQQLDLVVLAPDVERVWVQIDGNKIVLDQAINLIGRETENAITLDDPAVSHIHAEISRSANMWFLRDQGSKNGTFVNKERLIAPYELKADDVISIGTTNLTFHTSASSAEPESETDTDEKPMLEVEDLSVPESEKHKHDPDQETPVDIDETGDVVEETPQPEIQEDGPERSPLLETGYGCINCGELIDASFEFCPRCGSRQEGHAEHALQKKRLVTVQEGDEAGKSVEFTESLTIGRDPDTCQLIMDHVLVSRTHARITVTDEGVRLEDLGSRNGTELNGAKVTDEAIEIFPGDEILLGKKIVLVYQEP
jgi:pSer/pThr/pTyr-binding forkhead associated (FHA) protein/NADPH-dependent 2,4-dienoyl-CoA reductase/sulfur reductase-like enzyme